MGYYRSTSCPYCKTPIETRKRTGINDISNDIGAPAERCRWCGKYYKTGKQYWNSMSESQKGKTYIKLTVSYFATAFVISFLIFIGMWLLGLIFGFDVDDLVFGPLGIIILIVGFALSIRRNSKEFKELKALDDDSLT